MPFHAPAFLAQEVEVQVNRGAFRGGEGALQVSFSYYLTLCGV